VPDDKPGALKIQTAETEYHVTYTEGGNTLTFTGFEVRAAGLELIQLKLQNTEKQAYLFVKYERTPDGLTVYRLNPEVVSAKCQTAEELGSDLTVHRQNPFLFSAPLKFSRSADR
jgi:hypothetical protein